MATTKLLSSIYVIPFAVILLWLPDFSSSTKINITVSDSPKLVGLLDELNNPEDTNATIFCSIGSGDLNGISYEWFKDQERLFSIPRKIKIDVPVDNDQSVLRIFNLKPNDTALYTCIAKNRFGQDKISTKLNVKVQLKWLEQPTDLQVPAGKSVQVPCSAEGNPAPKIQWRRVIKDGRAELIGHELAFSAIKPDHSGIYECRATNEVDEDLVSRIQLAVLGK